MTMTNQLIPAPLQTPAIHRARASFRIGQRAKMVASVKITSGGILSVGALVSGILLSTAVLVRASVRARQVRTGD